MTNPQDEVTRLGEENAKLRKEIARLESERDQWRREMLLACEFMRWQLLRRIKRDKEKRNAVRAQDR